MLTQYVRTLTQFFISLFSFKEYGVLLEMQDHELLDDGRMLVNSVGGRRFKVRKVLVDFFQFISIFVFIVKFVISWFLFIFSTLKGDCSP